MKRIAILLALCGLGNASCAKHPVIFVTAVTGVLAGGTCEMDTATNKVCAITTLIVAAALGGLTALVTHFADTTAHELPPDEEIAPNGVVRLHTHTAPPPVPAAVLDAGVTDAAPDAVDAVTLPPDA